MDGFTEMNVNDKNSLSQVLGHNKLYNVQIYQKSQEENLFSTHYSHMWIKMNALLDFITCGLASSNLRISHQTIIVILIVT